jgi:hypothetical protein
VARRIFALVMLLAIGAFARCSLGDYRVGQPPSFSLHATPEFVVVDPGDSAVAIEISATRSPSFQGAIILTASGLGVAQQPATIAASATTSTLDIVLPNGTYPPETTIDVAGTSGALTAHVAVTVHIGSLVVPNDAGVLSVPAQARGIVVKAWGAGGGCGWNDTVSSNGGGGGFASARFDAPVPQLVTVVGEPGGHSGAWTSGGGGGFSGVREIDGGLWLIAGGGGGGGAIDPSAVGGAGGGLTGGGGAGVGTCGGGGGAQQAGGDAGYCHTIMASTGLPFQGGPGAGADGGGAGGAPGGGAGGAICCYTAPGGGGGGGYFGGGGGTMCTNGEANGGGGGSGYVRDGGVDASLAMGVGGSAANGSDPDICDKSTGQGGCYAAAGCVIVRLVKP